MNFKTVALLGSTSLASLLLAVPAIGQEAGSDVPLRKGEETADSVSVPDIVVTGYRAALGSAQDMKRQSDAIVDAIVSEDIGKLPDNNAAEAISRVVGVQVLRYNDEAGVVLVRGLPDVNTTFNGRELFVRSCRL